MDSIINAKTFVKAIELLERTNPFYKKILNIDRFKGIIELAELLTIMKKLDPKTWMNFIAGLIILGVNENQSDSLKKEEMIALSEDLTEPMLSVMRKYFKSDEYIISILEKYIDGDEEIAEGVTIPITVKKIHRFLRSTNGEIPFTMEDVDTNVHIYQHYRNKLNRKTDPSIQDSSVDDNPDEAQKETIRINGELADLEKDMIEILTSHNTKNNKVFMDETDIKYFINQNFAASNVTVPEIKTFTPNMNKTELRHVFWIIYNKYHMSKQKPLWHRIFNQNFPSSFTKDMTNLKDYSIEYLKL